MDAKFIDSKLHKMSNWTYRCKSNVDQGHPSYNVGQRYNADLDGVDNSIATIRTLNNRVPGVVDEKMVYACVRLAVLVFQHNSFYISYNRMPLVNKKVISQYISWLRKFAYNLETKLGIPRKDGVNMYFDCFQWNWENEL